MLVLKIAIAKEQEAFSSFPSVGVFVAASSPLHPGVFINASQVEPF